MTRELTRLFFDSRFYVHFTLSALYSRVLSSSLYCTNWGSVLIWLFVACFSALVGGSLVSSLIIVELFLWFGKYG